MADQSAPRSRRTRLRRSPHTERALAAAHLRPRLRGKSHLWAAVVSVPLAIVWAATAPGGVPRLGVGAFAGGVATMFVCSALLHLRPWSGHVHERLLRLDHTGIFLAISGTGVAVGLLGLEGRPGTVLVSVSVVGAVVGTVLEWLPFPAPPGMANTTYLVLGWFPVLLLPWLWRDAGPLAVALLLVGGLLYTVGAVIVGLRRPGRTARWFGYHELFHALVIVAVVVHAVLVLVLLR